MDWFLYDNGLRHERVNERFFSFSLIDHTIPGSHYSRFIVIF